MIYVDNAAIMYKGKLRYHMTANSIAELHAFAAEVGIKRCWWHSGSRYPHYDINGLERDRAIAAGAAPVTSKELLLVTKAITK